MIKRILVGIADSPYTASATRHAIDIAKRCDASLTGVSVMDFSRIRDAALTIPAGSSQTKDSREAAFETVRASIDAAVDTFVRICVDAGATYDFCKKSGDPFAEFIEQSKYHDLMVCGLHRLFEHGVVPEPKNELAKLVSAGVRPIIATAVEHREVNRVLVAYSGSVESAKTMRRFTQLYPYLTPDAKVRLVSFGAKDGTGPSLLIEARNYMQAHSIEPETHYVVGTARAKLLNHATEWKADMIVLGNSAKSLLRKQVLGETALHTIKEADIPLFLAQ